jgi:hypothetical protein
MHVVQSHRSLVFGMLIIIIFFQHHLIRFQDMIKISGLDLDFFKVGRRSTDSENKTILYCTCSSISTNLCILSDYLTVGCTSTKRLRHHYNKMVGWAEGNVVMLM